MFRRKKKAAREAPEVFSYDRGVLASCIRRYYELLTAMGHLRTAAVQWPPEPAGWSDSELNVDALRALGRTETVIDLLRHIPYPRAGPPGSDEEGNDATVHYETMVLSYLRDRWHPEQDGDPDWYQKPFCYLGLGPFDKPMAAHLISLTHEEAEIGTIWVIDTERGCIYPHGGEYLLYDDAPLEVEEKPWLSAKTLSFQTYFDKIHKEISSLKLVLVPGAGNFGPSIRGPRDPESKAIKDLYREYGWPNAFQKEEFLKAAVAARTVILDDTHWSDVE